MAFTIEIICILSASVVLFLLYLKRNRQYWSKRNVPSINTNSLWGNIENPLTTQKGINGKIKEAYDEFKKQGHKHGGVHVLIDPVYMPVDPELIKHVLAKDFQYFTGHGNVVDTDKDPLAANLFSLDGKDWRDMRVKLTPTFTSGKMKIMFPTLVDCAIPMIKEIDQSVADAKTLNIKDITSKFTIDVIGSVVFGVECNSFKDPDAEFRRYGIEISNPPLARALALITTFYIPRIQEWFHFKVISNEMEAFFLKTIGSILTHRETNNVKRNDFIQQFLEINEKAKTNGEEPLTLHEITAQCFLFFAAGFDTSSTTMAFCLHELAFNQKIQDTLREEIQETMQKHGGKLTYEGIMEMKYIDKVVSETLRKYPVLGVIGRQCTMDYNVPNTDVIIEKGTRVFISSLGLHKDEEYYPNPDLFDPERFTEENKAKRHPYSYIPFGEGPRTCIGLRFGLMQVKTGLSMILSRFKILPAKGEKHEIEFDPRTFVITKKGDVLVNAVKIEP